jgi:hypothetical protein
MPEKEKLSLKKHKDLKNPMVESALAEGTVFAKRAPEFRKKESSMYFLLKETFIPDSSKDGNIKLAKVTKATLKAISDLEDNSALDDISVDELISCISKTDPALTSVAQIAVVAAKSKKMKLRRTLLEFCVRAASSCWIHNYRQSNNLYREILESHNKLDTDALSFLHHALNSAYDKRIANLKPHQKPSTENVSQVETNTEIKPTTNADSEPLLSFSKMDAQKDSVLTIGALWLLVKGDISPKSLINTFTELYEGIKSRHQDEMAVAMFLAAQFSTAKSGLADTLNYFKQQYSELADRQKLAQNSLLAKTHELDRAKGLIAEKAQAIEELNKTNRHQQAEIERLENALEQHVLDEKAKRVHLRDDTGRAKAKAINLLSEEVLEPLRLSLSALRRDNPKIEVAAHHIDLVVETVERELPWFKE